MDLIKDAFLKVKEDILLIKEEINKIKKELSEIQTSILTILKMQDTLFNHDSTNLIKNTPLKQINETSDSIHFNNQTDNSNFKGLKTNNINLSIGNQGVSTDRQTDRQTDKPTDPLIQTPYNSKLKTTDLTIILNQLDALKKDIRLKVKKLTNQEMVVFSSIYQFENEGISVDYSYLANNLNLSESSIRDYIQRIIKKGLPIIKEKKNNKKVIVKIPLEFKQLATLNTLIQLREL
ncbi:MAG: hypothetical protein QW727_00220 [Candidatus Pacearchaeota archaeon]